MTRKKNRLLAAIIFSSAIEGVNVASRIEGLAISGSLWKVILRSIPGLIICSALYGFIKLLSPLGGS
jgi:hypothetical protein